MPVTVEHLLNIYRVRQGCQEEGITNPSNAIKEFTNTLVESLEKEDMGELVDTKKVSNGATQFIILKTGKILAEMPNRS